MKLIILLIIVSSPDGLYVSQQWFDNSIECQIASDEFTHRAELTRTLDDIVVNECIEQ